MTNGVEAGDDEVEEHVDEVGQDKHGSSVHEAVDERERNNDHGHAEQQSHLHLTCERRKC